MRRAQVKKALRIDHSIEFPKRLKMWLDGGNNECAKDLKMLLLAQNEICQIAGRSFTKSENSEETEALLKSIASSDVSLPTDTRYLVTDNANAVRKMAHRCNGPRPLHEGEADSQIVCRPPPSACLMSAKNKKQE